MIRTGNYFDEDMILAKINKAANSAVPKSDTAEAGQVPLSDGEGGVTWGAVVAGTFAVVDANNDGNIQFQYTEGD